MVLTPDLDEEKPPLITTKEEEADRNWHLFILIVISTFTYNIYYSNIGFIFNPIILFIKIKIRFFYFWNK